MNILIVEDDEKIASFIQKGLKESGHTASIIADGLVAKDTLTQDHSFELVILDIMLPSLNGLSVLESIRSKSKYVPVIILSAKRSVEEKVLGLVQGADDYLEKPFAFSELLARIQVLMRRQGGNKPLQTSLSYSGLSVDLLKREVLRDGEKIELQAKEFSLLEFFLRHPDRVVTKTMILENIYGYHFDTQTNVVDVLVFRLRNKIDKNFTKKLIQTIRGVGYVLKED